jgi:hypothetical protein
MAGRAGPDPGGAPFAHRTGPALSLVFEFDCQYAEALMPPLRPVFPPSSRGLAAIVAIALAVLAAPAFAGEAADLEKILDHIEKQDAQIQTQQRQIEELRRTVESLTTELRRTNDDAPADAPPAPTSDSDATVVVPAPAPGPSPEPRAETFEVRAPEAGAEKDGGSFLDRISANSYATAYYAHYDWQTDPQRSDAIDLERVTLEVEIEPTETTKIEVEAEFEHLGTGATMEFDRFEEFGEFETEIERGGEVELEELLVEWEPYEEIGLRAGYFPIGVGLTNFRHRPGQYFGTTRFESEVTLIPDVWSEAGLGAFGKLDFERYGALAWRLEAVTGLDSTGFSSANWVKRGHQTRFENINAEDFAGVARLDYSLPWPEAFVGSSFYYGNTAGNRPKPDLQVDAPVMIWDVHGEYIRGPLEVRALYMRGHLDDAARVSQANARLSNNLNVKRTPVGDEAFATFVEAGVHVDNFFRLWPSGLIPFYRWDHYDTQAEVEAPIIRNPFNDRETHTVGLNYRPTSWLVLKGQYSMRTRGIPASNDENTLSIGFGYDVDF